jgi:transcriptional regulator with XRE-family HTH domain
MAGPSPTVRQRRLARTLRDLREKAGLTIEQVGEKLEVSPSTISRMETANVGVRPLDLIVLLDLYQVTGKHRDELLQIARERRRQPWWVKFKDLPKLDFAALEAEASSILQYSALVVPGLMQTKEYAIDVLKAFQLDQGPDGIEGHLNLRMERQARFFENQPQYWLVLDEAVLHRMVGGPKLMCAQLQHLIDVSSQPNVVLQVLPYSAGAHPGMDGEFTILQYREAADPDSVYIENSAGDIYLDATNNPDETKRYQTIFEHLRAAALNRVESVRLLTSLHRQLEQREGS